MSAIDAHDARDLPGLIREEEPGAASPSSHPILEEPLTPQTASSFDPSSPSLQLPFFTNNSSSPVSHRDLSSSCPFLTRDVNQGIDSNLAPRANCLPLCYTFYLAPLASKSSGGFSARWSGHGSSSGETHSTMPGPTADAPAEQQFLTPTIADYFSLSGSAQSPADSRTDFVRLPPSSAGSGRSEPTAGPLSFARWGRRHHRRHTDGYNHQDEEGRKLLRRGCRSAERKASSRSSPKRSGRSRSNSIQKRQPQAAGVPQMTREEFEALPLAIQRKYFSTLERLRFARDSGLVDGISRHYDDVSNFKRRQPQRDWHRQGSLIGSQFSTSDSSLLYSEATQEAESRREEHMNLAGRQRASVILDAADEAVYKLKQQASRRDLSTAAEVLTPPLSPTRNSMDSHDGPRRHDIDQSGDGQVPHSFYESFRWLDEEEDLDLRFFLDDYHANLREGTLREGTPTTNQRPSFRRRMSVSKIPFGRRSSISSSRPGTKDATTAPRVHSPTGSVSNGLTHMRRKSRALSLITSKHAPQPSLTAFDPAAAHYQDPEARLKLRVYLASPQKFDEAVEFGFPSTEGLSAAPAVLKPADGSSDMRTFLADDDDHLSLNSDQPSLPDPDSPKTPEALEHKANGPRHARFASAGALNGRDFGKKTPEGVCYAQMPASSREMTLRMTLTRPDLRTPEDEMYGWQQKQAYQQHSRQQTAPASLAIETRGAYLGNGSHKDSLENFHDVHHWNGTTAEKGVMRRIWNRVRRV
ncbi:hypothetical protein C8A03DRAFT_41867 [Achaetomium macrosporum]|uniref:Mucin n=1 Tax=Achaetomium macrosporum TaxID=79813 RepID=A0AAN7CG39_9PEZI|nr:hypothetical protein C8A03DRAFT_41867 [Achaetomium macrosporum]